MRKQFIYLLFLLFFTTSVQAQYLQLVENKGEFGVFAGQASYNGDLAPSLQFLSTNFGVFYSLLNNSCDREAQVLVCTLSHDLICHLVFNLAIFLPLVSVTRVSMVL